jgi:hypothetical protein
MRYDDVPRPKRDKPEQRDNGQGTDREIHRRGSKELRYNELIDMINLIYCYCG